MRHGKNANDDDRAISIYNDATTHRRTLFSARALQSNDGTSKQKKTKKHPHIEKPASQPTV